MRAAHMRSTSNPSDLAATNERGRKRTDGAGDLVCRGVRATPGQAGGAGTRHAGVGVFAPRLPRTRKRNGDKPLFPGYLFVRVDRDEGMWARLRFVPGVRNLVAMGGEPCPVDGSLVEAIRRRVAVFTPPDRKPLPGDRVRVIAGSFTDIEGLLCESLKGEERWLC